MELKTQNYETKKKTKKKKTTGDEFRINLQNFDSRQ